MHLAHHKLKGISATSMIVAMIPVGISQSRQQRWLSLFTFCIAQKVSQLMIAWVCKLQGYKVQLELWKVLLEDSRWRGMTGPFDPTKFNPSRSVLHQSSMLQRACHDAGMHSLSCETCTLESQHDTRCQNDTARICLSPLQILSF